MDKVKVPALKLDEATPVGSPSPLRPDLDVEIFDKENREYDIQSYEISERSKAA